ncbi:hypothetical protein FMZ60_00020 [Alcaligenaceae bacterium SJ-26]|nr:hypothetical protein FMZ60_00020 [Alcaligenaceae bacterium SJ-26]
MKINFPHGPKNHIISEKKFIAAWKTWFLLFRTHENLDARFDGMPISNSKTSLQEQIKKGKKFSLDVLCRMLVPHRNTMQASTQFIEKNNQIFIEYSAKNLSTGRTAKHVRLSNYALGLLEKISHDDQYEIDAILNADIEDEKNGLLEIENFEPEITPQYPISLPSNLTCLTQQSLVTTLVATIHAEPFQPHYRGQPIMKQVQGWDRRLTSYFWPKPDFGVAETETRLRPLLDQAAALQATLRNGQIWTEAEKQSAHQLAEAIFLWGGVPQNNITTEKILAVFKSVNHGKQIERAPMNSGWTKLAAIASASNGPANEHVIWDSRVAHSLLKRLDSILSASGITIPPDYLSHLGHIPGRGGSRTTAKYHINWPNGYQKWSSQFAGSEIVRKIRDELNKNIKLYPVGTSNQGATWTLREVEMVLFMDGY